MKKLRPQSAQSGIPAVTADRIAEVLAVLPPAGQTVLKRLIQEVAERGGLLPAGMLNDLQAISIEGVDPLWQVEKLEEIMDRWLRPH